jgi:ubiquinone/menaquinone biosynthesis C-methylase UbiE
VDIAAIASGNRVLDVASGRGAVLFPAAEKVGASGDVVGIDLAEEMVGATNEDAARLGLRVRVKLMDAEHLDFPDAAFDRVLCGFGIMFFPNQERALREFHRVLHPGGQLAVSTWHTHQVKELDLAMTAAGLNPPRLPGWIKEPDQLAQLLSATGFRNVHVDMDTHSFRYANADHYWEQARALDCAVPWIRWTPHRPNASALLWSNVCDSTSGQTASTWRQRRYWLRRTVNWQSARVGCGDRSECIGLLHCDRPA